MQPQDSLLSCKPQHPHLSTKEGNFAHAGMSALSTVHPYHCSARSGLSCGRPLPRPSSSARRGGGVPARRGHTPPAGPAAWGAHRGQAEVTGCQRIPGSRTGALLCSLNVLNPSVPPFSQVLTDRLALPAAEAKPALAQMP